MPAESLQGTVTCALPPTTALALERALAMTTILFKTCAWCGIETDNMPLCELHEAQAQNEQLTTDWIEATNTIHQYATEINSLRTQLTTCHEAIGAALALLRQEQVGAAMLVLDDALKGRTR